MEVCQFSKMVKTRFWQPWEANFWPWRCVNSQKWRFRGAGAFGRPIFGQGGVPIHQNGDFKVLSLLVGQFLARWCFNSPKWRFRGAGAFGRPIFGQGGVPIRKNGDF